MTKFDLNNITPYMAVHAGEFLKDELSARKITQKQLSALTGIQAPIINDIIKGKRDVTAEQSILIGRALEIDDTFFFDMQKQYEIDKARISKRVAEQSAAMDIWRMIEQYISVLFFKSVGIITNDVKRDVETIFSVFGVNNLEEFLVLQKKEMEFGYYKRSDKLTTDEKDLFSWRYYCSYLSKQTTLQNTFSKSDKDALILELNKIFTDGVYIKDKTKDICEKYGIKFFIVNKMGQLPVDGMSFMVDNTPTIALTMRKRNLDNFAFSLMHELGHVYLHLDGDEKYYVSFGEQNVDHNSYESEANKFASDALIPESKWKAFRNKTNNVSPYSMQIRIDEFAKENGIHPAIVMGRYQHETNLYNMRNKFRINVE